MKLPTRYWRSYSTLKQALPAKTVRSRFLEYFINENGHQFVKSSSVLPHFDYSIPFVHSGMCQFKRVFLSEEAIDYSKVANSQKCIRVEGKHDDVDIVGFDPHHHTFFEMLGNWSFGSYGKKEACRLAWNLLTSAPYSIPPHKLFVTYFGGDEKLNLPADDDIREIWLELGVRPERILPFDRSENFWEMNWIGPCGTCTEIHVALTDDVCSRPDLVNRNNPSIVELWNIAFIKYNRTENGLISLSKEFIDAGIGFERLVSALQQKTSSYSTELYEPLINVIEKITGAPKYSGTFNEANQDALYRRLADFSRMITVSITDNVFPDLNSRLKRVLRKALFIARNDFKQSSPEHLIIELSKVVADSLHEVFPEIGCHLNQVKLVVENEAKLVEELIRTRTDWWNMAVAQYPILRSFNLIEYPGLPNSYRYLMKEIDQYKLRDVIPAEMVLSMKDKHGLDSSVIQKIASSFKLTINWDEVESQKRLVESRSKNSSRPVADFETVLHRLNIQTDDSFKHEYFRKDGTEAPAAYVFPDVTARLLVILRRRNIVSINREPESLPADMAASANAEVEIDNEEVGLIFDRTNFVCENGGVSCDKGHVIIDGQIRFAVTRTKKQRPYVIHYVQLLDDRTEQHTRLRTGVQVTLQIDPVHRLSIMRNNTLSQLIVAAMKDMFPLMYLTMFNINEERAAMNIHVYETESDFNDYIQPIQEKIDNCIRKKSPVEITIVPTGSQLLKMPDVVIQSGFIYPFKNIRLVSVLGPNDKYIREPCDNVHVLNTGDIESALVVCTQQIKFKHITVCGITGDSVKRALHLEKWARTQADSMKEQAIVDDSATAEETFDVAEKLFPVLLKLKEEHSQSSYLFTPRTTESMRRMSHLNRVVISKLSQLPRELVVRYFRTKVEEQANRDKCAVYFSVFDLNVFRHNSFVIDVLYMNKFPSLFFCYFREHLHCVCHVPECCIREGFNARIWLESVMSKANVQFNIQDDVEQNIFCYLKRERIEAKRIVDLIEPLLVLGKSTAAELISKK